MLYEYYKCRYSFVSSSLDHDVATFIIFIQHCFYIVLTIMILNSQKVYELCTIEEIENDRIAYLDKEAIHPTIKEKKEERKQKCKRRFYY